MGGKHVSQWLEAVLLIIRKMESRIACNYTVDGMNSFTWASTKLPCPFLLRLPQMPQMPLIRPVLAIQHVLADGLLLYIGLTSVRLLTLHGLVWPVCRQSSPVDGVHDKHVFQKDKTSLSQRPDHLGVFLGAVLGPNE